MVLPGISLRLFEPSDGPALTTFLHRAYAELGDRGLNFTAVDQDLETTLFRAAKGRCWVAVADGQDGASRDGVGQESACEDGAGQVDSCEDGNVECRDVEGRDVECRDGEEGGRADATPDDSALHRSPPSAGQIVGTLTISLPPGRHLEALTPLAERAGAWLNQMAVDPDLRGQGIAARMWRAGLAWAAAQGVTTIGVDTAVPATHLQELYAQWGFEPYGTIQWPGKTYESTVMLRGVAARDLL